MSKPHLPPPSLHAKVFVNKVNDFFTNLVYKIYILCKLQGMEQLTFLNFTKYTAILDDMVHQELFS